MLRRVDKTKQDQVCEQDSPVRSESSDQARPVDLFGAREEQMHEVRAVKTLPLHDERLGPDHLLDRAELDGNAERFAVRAVLEPPGVHARNPIAGIEKDRKSTRLNSSHANISYAVF